MARRRKLQIFLLAGVVIYLTLVAGCDKRPTEIEAKSAIKNHFEAPPFSGYWLSQTWCYETFHFNRERERVWIQEVRITAIGERKEAKWPSGPIRTTYWWPVTAEVRLICESDKYHSITKSGEFDLIEDNGRWSVSR